MSSPIGKRMRAGYAPGTPGTLVGTALRTGANFFASPATLLGIVGYSNGTGAPYWILVFEAPDYSAIANNAFAAFSIYISGAGNYAFAVPGGGVDLESCCAVASSTPDFLTEINGNNQSYQGIVSPL